MGLFSEGIKPCGAAQLSASLWKNTRPKTCQNTSAFVILREVEESHKPKVKAVNLSFFNLFDKETGCFDYGRCPTLNMTKH